MRKLIIRSTGATLAALAACAVLAVPAAAAAAPSSAAPAVTSTDVRPAAWVRYWVYSTQQQCTEAGQWLVNQGRAQSFQCVYTGVWSYELWIWV